MDQTEQLVLQEEERLTITVESSGVFITQTNVFMQEEDSFVAISFERLPAVVNWLARVLEQYAARH